MGEDRGPSGLFRVRRFRDHPEAPIWVVDDREELTCGGADRPGATEEIQCGIAVETALEV